MKSFSIETTLIKSCTNIYSKLMAILAGMENPSYTTSETSLSLLSNSLSYSCSVPEAHAESVLTDWTRCSANSLKVIVSVIIKNKNAIGPIKINQIQN